MFIFSFFTKESKLNTNFKNISAYIDLFYPLKRQFCSRALCRQKVWTFMFCTEAGRSEEQQLLHGWFCSPAAAGRAGRPSSSIPRWSAVTLCASVFLEYVWHPCALSCPPGYWIGKLWAHIKLIHILSNLLVDAHYIGSRLAPEFGNSTSKQLTEKKIFQVFCSNLRVG